MEKLKNKRKYINDFKNKSGITLIALVITIIVLLLLAGVTIATLTGENGLITRAKEAKNETKRSQALEELKLEIMQIQVEKGERADLRDVIIKLYENKEYKVYVGDDLINESNPIIPDNIDKIFVEYKKYKFQIDYNFEVTLVETNDSTSGKEDETEEAKLNNDIKDLFASAKYNLTLEDLLQSDEFMKEILAKQEVRDYILNNDSIYMLAYKNQEIAKILNSNNAMKELMENDNRWKTIIFYDNLNVLIKNIKASYSYSSYLPKYAFDGEWTNPNNAWSTYLTDGIGQYIICEFKEEICLKELKIKPGTVNSEYVKQFTIYGSNDDINYVQIFIGEHQDNDEFETYQINSNSPYKYLKLEINSKHHNNVSFQEIIYSGNKYTNYNIEEANKESDNKIINKLFELSKCDLTLENLLQNKKIVNKILSVENARNYIINNDKINAIANDNNKIIKIFLANEQMKEKIINNNKWLDNIENKDLTSLIKDIKASYAYSPYLPGYAFDEEWTDPNSVWSTYPTGGIGQYVVCEFEEEICLRELKIKPGTINSEYVKQFTIYGSNDNVNYEQVFSAEHQDNDEFETYGIDNNKMYKYLKLEINSRHHNNVSFQEIIYRGF